MNWYQGEIGDAISKSKSKGAIFVVYIEGTDEKSKKITDLINFNGDVQKRLNSENFIAIKLQANSKLHQQFNQIFTDATVPSIFFIGKGGTPLLIITEPEDSQGFCLKLDSVCKMAELPVEATVNETSGVSASFIQDNQSSLSLANVSDNTSASASSSQSNNDNVLTNEEKVERAKQLIEMKREEKIKQEKEDERLKEIERRKMGQNVQKLKKMQEDQEFKQAIEDREKEKRENEAARKRVLAQIARDRTERAARFQSEMRPSTVSSPVLPRQVPNVNVTRIQFRLPDGKYCTHDFQSSDTLQMVYDYVSVDLNISNFTLSTTFPRRVFTDEEKLLSLLSLELVPSSVILVLPITRNAISTSNGNGFSSMFWSLLSPFVGIFNFMRNFLFGRPDTDNPNTNQNHSSRRTVTSLENEPNQNILSNLQRYFMYKRYPGESRVVRRQGNIHGLSNRNDSDDENNTWNGNSTQQM